MKWVILLLAVLFFPIILLSQNHLLISEIVVTPTGGEFVEIHNPTTNTIDLTNYYLTDATFASGGVFYYKIVTDSNAGGGGFGDFHARFPNGATIGSGEFQTIAMNGTDFTTTYGSPPTYELWDTDASIPDMLEAFTGSISNQGGLTNGGEVVVLYYWDGTSDLVQDVDYVVWGDKVEAVDKSGVSIDGPDTDTDSSTYLNDTPIANQISASSGTPHASGESLQRSSMTEVGETQTGGNGITGHDETSEDLATAFIAAAANPGSGPPVDEPPAISGLSRTPTIPAADQNTTVSAVVTDDNAVASVDLQYVINSVDTQTVAMTNVSGDTFSADIPSAAYMDGDAVEYWVSAEDNAAQTTQSNKAGFFAGTTPISNVHAVDANGALKYNGFDVMVTGVATVTNSTFSSSHLDVYIQDGTGGINIFKFNADALVTITIGNSYTVTGALDQYNGKAEIIPADATTDIIDNGPATPVEFTVKTIAELLADPETYEGMYIAIQQVTNTGGGDAWPAEGSNANLEITDDGGTSVMTLRIDRDTNIDGTAEPTWPVNVAGIMNQYDTSSPYTSGYQLLPRSTDDIDVAVKITRVGSELPITFKLHQNYPNPFNPSTTLQFDIPAKLGNKEQVQLAIYNALGQKVKTLFKGKLTAGQYEVQWNGRNDHGVPVPSGVYFAILKAPNLQEVVKLVLLK